MALFKKGDAAKLNVEIPSGTVIGMRMDDDGNVSCLLEWLDHEGEMQQRWFAETALVAVE